MNPKRSHAPPFAVRMAPANARGQAMGEAHGRCRWPDEVVAQARAMAAAGVSQAAIVAAMGAPRWTVRGWLNGTQRRPPARVIARRVRPPSPGSDEHSDERRSP